MDQTAVRLRHELKYSIDRGACALLRERLGAVMRSDAHAGAGSSPASSASYDARDSRSLSLWQSAPTFALRSSLMQPSSPS